MVEKILNDLLKGLDENELPHTVTFEIRFPEADDSDCLVLILLKKPVDTLKRRHQTLGFFAIPRV